jgi:hypothetical protein
MILMIGPPASGKSTFTKKYLVPHNYVHINRDALQTQEKCLKVCFFFKFIHKLEIKLNLRLPRLL